MIGKNTHISPLAGLLIIWGMPFFYPYFAPKGAFDDMGGRFSTHILPLKGLLDT